MDGRKLATFGYVAGWSLLAAHDHRDTQRPRGKFLEEVARSVVLHDYLKLEYIIIDDKSSEERIEIIFKHGERLAYWVSELDWRQSHAINKGFQKATGEILG